MRDSFLKGFLRKGSYIYLLLSGGASALGFMALTGYIPGFQDGPTSLSTLLFWGVGILVSATALFNWRDYLDTGDLWALTLASALSLTTIFGFLTFTTAEVDRAIESKSRMAGLNKALSVATADVEQLRKNELLRDRRYARNTLDTVLGMISQEKREGNAIAASSLALFSDIADFWNSDVRTVSALILIFLGFVVEGNMIRTDHRTRTRDGKRTRTAKPNSANANSLPVANTGGSYANGSANKSTSGSANKPKANSEEIQKVVEMVLAQKELGDPTPYATVARQLGTMTNDAVRMIYNRWEKAHQESAS